MYVAVNIPAVLVILWPSYSTHMQKFTDKTFTKVGNTMKFTKVFSPMKVSGCVVCIGDFQRVVGVYFILEPAVFESRVLIGQSGIYFS